MKKKKKDSKTSLVSRLVIWEESGTDVSPTIPRFRRWIPSWLRDWGTENRFHHWLRFTTFWAHSVLNGDHVLFGVFQMSFVWNSWLWLIPCHNSYDMFVSETAGVSEVDYAITHRLRIIEIMHVKHYTVYLPWSKQAINVSDDDHTIMWLPCFSFYCLPLWVLSHPVLVMWELITCGSQRLPNLKNAYVITFSSPNQIPDTP